MFLIPVQVCTHLYTSPDETVDIVMSQVPHQLHLLHHLPADVLLPLELELLDPHDAPVVLGSLTEGTKHSGVTWQTKYV